MTSLAPAARRVLAPPIGDNRAPALYETTVRHVRRTPLRSAFRYRSYQWLVDLDALPELPRPIRGFARFCASDHFGDPSLPIRANVDRYLAGHGIDVHGGRIRMLTNARVLGYVFNPLTVYWCHAETGDLACVIAEVHNTYGGRHCYLLRPDHRGRATAAKEFYVSPFFEIAGHYTMSLPEPGERLALHITFHPPDGSAFVASVSGHRLPARGRSLARLVVARPWATAAISARIRWQGVKLYLRGLPVVPRPSSHAKGRKA